MGATILIRHEKYFYKYRNHILQAILAPADRWTNNRSHLILRLYAIDLLQLVISWFKYDTLYLISYSTQTSKQTNKKDVKKKKYQKMH